MKLLKKIKDAIFSSRKTIISVCACILVITLVAAVIFNSVYIPSSVEGAMFGTSEYTPTAVGELIEDARSPENMKLMCENDFLALFYDETISNMAVLDKVNGNYWFTNPQNASDDTLATGTLLDNLRSAFTITYYDSKDKATTLNTYKYSVLNDSLKYEFIENGVRFSYQMGDTKVTKNMLPAVVEKNKFEEKILENLSGENLSAVQQFYKLQSLSTISSLVTVSAFKELYTTIDEDKEYYFLDLYTPEYKLEALYSAIYGTAKYTAEEVAKDNESVGYNVEVDAFVRFVIPVEYKLQDDAFTVSIPAEEIETPAGLYLTDISFLPFFGSSGEGDRGYMFVPDGSGALVNFNNGRKVSYPYSVPVYGEDAAIKREEVNFSSARANIPVFGIVYENEKSLLAIIEEGESHATLTTQVSGGENNRNYIYASFNVRTMEVEELEDAKFDVSSNLYQQEPYKGSLTVRYSFTGENNANYSSLACIYREYLRDKGVLKAKNSKLQFALKLIGNVEVDASFMGIPYKTTESVTTFRQAIDITQQLKERGINDINLGFMSWFGGGIDHTPVIGKVSAAGGVGSKGDIKKLNQTLKEGGNLSLGADLLTVHRSFPKFNQFINAVRFLNNEIVVGYDYDLATWQPNERDRTHYYLSSRYAKSVFDDFSASVSKLDTDGLWLNDIGNILASDFAPNSNIDREVSKQLISSALADVSSDNSVTLENPDKYVWESTDNAVNLPVKSSENILINESVPFLQIVLSGSIRYAGNAFNRSSNYDDNLLKAAETGADIYYEWIYMPDVEVSALKGIETEKLYSMCYEGWIDTATSQYKLLKEKLSIVSGEEIIGHSKIADNVYKTEYENTAVYTNYGYEDVTVEGITVPARDFTVIKGEGK